MGPLEIAASILSRAQQRVENAAQNMANMTTPGFKSHRQFLDMIDAASPAVQTDSLSNSVNTIDFGDGKLQSTGNPYDIALSGSGFFTVRSGDSVRYTRDGQFHRDADGRLITSDGLALQSDAGDVTVTGSDIKILRDGTVLDGNEPVARLVIADFSDKQQLVPSGAGLFEAPASAAREVASPVVRQGMLESSNVSTADEMITIMAAVRSAESGQRVVQVYDDLMGRALTAFGQL